MRQAIMAIQRLSATGAVSGAFGVTIETAQFFGAGLNDLTSSGSWSSDAANAQFLIVISGTGTPDHFKWSKNGGSLSSAVAITGAAQSLSDGVKVTFAATTGHTLNDKWVVNTEASAGDAPATVTPVASPTGPIATIAQAAGARFRTMEDKGRDTISLKDFCVGDGITVETSQLRLAIEALRDRSMAPGSLAKACTLVIPPGDFLFDQLVVFDRFTGLCIKGSGSQSILRYVGAAGDGPALLFSGCFAPLLEDFTIAVNAGSGLGHVVAIQEYVPGGPPATISTKHKWKNVLVTSFGADCYVGFLIGTAVNGTTGADFNNDFHEFRGVIVRGVLDSGWWFMGSQAVSNVLNQCTMEGTDTSGMLPRIFGKFAVKATPIRGGFLAAASWSAGVATFTTTKPHGLTTGHWVSVACTEFAWDIFTRGGIDPAPTVTSTTTFTLPMAVDPTATPFSGGTWWESGVGGRAAAAFRSHGLGTSTNTASYFIDGYSDELFLLSYGEHEDTGRLLHAVNGALRYISVENTRWARNPAFAEVVNNPSDTDFIYVQGGGLKIDTTFAHADGPGIGGGAGNVYEDLTIHYEAGGIRQAQVVILDSLFATSKTTMATFFGGSSSPATFLTKRNMQWVGLDGGVTSGWFDNTRTYSPPDAGAAAVPVTTPLLTAAQPVPFAFVASATWTTGVATYTIGAYTDTRDSFRNGETLTIDGMVPSGYNVTGTITVIDRLHFTIAIVSNPGSASTSGGEAFRPDDDANYTTTVALFGVSSGGFLTGTGAGIAPVEIGTGTTDKFPVIDIGDSLKGTVIQATNSGSGQTKLSFANHQHSTGPNDLSSSGTWIDDALAHTITVAITEAGTPDRFKWRVDAGPWYVGTAITGSTQALLGGVSVAFVATTGHPSATSWSIDIASSTGTVSAPVLLTNGQFIFPDFFEIDSLGPVTLRRALFADITGAAAGSIGIVTDANSNGFGDSISSGGGIYEVLVYSDGATLTVFGGAGVHVSTSDPTIANLQAQITAQAATISGLASSVAALVTIVATKASSGGSTSSAGTPAHTHTI